MENGLHAWAQRLRETGDLNGALRELGGHKGGWPETLRGRVHLLQMRLDDGMERLRRAMEMLQKEPESDENSRRVLVCLAYQREGRLLSGKAAPRKPTPALDVVRESFRDILKAHQSCDAAERLWVGRHEEASAIWRNLLRNTRGGDHENRSFWHLGIALCLWNVGAPARANQELEYASLHALAVDNVLGKVRLAARLEAICDRLRQIRRAGEWCRWIRSLPCPDRTKQAARLRARLIASSRSGRRLVLA